MDILLPIADQVLKPLRPYLSPITHNLPEPVSSFLTSLIGPTCYTHILTDLSVSASPACTTLLLSKLIGYAILTLSLVVKLPQLLKLLSSRSSTGISFTSYLLETVAYAITLAYNFRNNNPISTYGEIAVIAVQNVVVAALVLEFRGKRAGAGLFVAAVAAGSYALFDETVVNREMLGWLQTATIPLGIASKVPQIWQVQKAKSTGQLSAFAVFNYLGGSLARVFTTLAEIDDPVILIGYLGGAFLNIVLAVQMVWFWNSSAKGKTGKKFYAKQGQKGKKRA